METKTVECLACGSIFEAKPDEIHLWYNDFFYRLTAHCPNCGKATASGLPIKKIPAGEKLSDFKILKIDHGERHRKTAVTTLYWK